MGISGRGGVRDGGGRPSNWQNTPTTTIRVPEVLAEKLLEIAHELDRGLRHSLVIDTKSLDLHLQKKQQHLFMPRVYKQSGHETIRVKDLIEALQHSVED